MTIQLPFLDCPEQIRKSVLRFAASRRVLRLAHALSALLGVYAILFTYLSLSQLTHERRLREIEHLLVIGLLDAESGQRAYLLTSDRLFLAQYEAGIATIEVYEPVYASALASTESRQVFQKVATLLRLKETEMRMTIVTHDQVGSKEATLIVCNRLGHGYTGDIYDLLGKIQAIEAHKAVPFELWRLPGEPDIHDSSHAFSPSALIMRLSSR